MKKPLNTRIITRAATVLTCAVCAVGLMTGCSQGSKADSAASAPATSGDEYLLKMAKCMRDKGIDVSDPDSNGNMQFPETDAANKAAECLRKEGYDVPDPEAGKGIQLNGDIPQDVMGKCFSELGNK